MESTVLTRPDFEVFVPREGEGPEGTGQNQHFLVFESPDGSLLAIWTQGSASQAPGKRLRHRIVFAQSDDDGRTWTPP